MAVTSSTQGSRCRCECAPWPTNLLLPGDATGVAVLVLGSKHERRRCAPLPIAGSSRSACGRYSKTAALPTKAGAGHPRRRASEVRAMQGAHMHPRTLCMHLCMRACLQPRQQQQRQQRRELRTALQCHTPRAAVTAPTCSMGCTKCVYCSISGTYRITQCCKPDDFQTSDLPSSWRGELRLATGGRGPRSGGHGS